MTFELKKIFSSRPVTPNDPLTLNSVHQESYRHNWPRVTSNQGSVLHFRFREKDLDSCKNFKANQFFVYFWNLSWTKFDFGNQVIWNGLIFIFSRFWNEPLWDIWNFEFLENISKHRLDRNWNLILEFQKHAFHWPIPRCASRKKAFKFMTPMVTCHLTYNSHLWDTVMHYAA